jgi:hypothetical protein
MKVCCNPQPSQLQNKEKAAGTGWAGGYVDEMIQANVLEVCGYETVVQLAANDFTEVMYKIRPTRK